MHRGFVLSRSGECDETTGIREGGENPQGVVGKKRETERFMSDMVIFISRGKKARFHAVGAFIPFSDDKGTERENGECGIREGESWRRREREKRKREREKEIRRHAKTLKLWTRFSKEPCIRGNANNRDSRPYVEALACRSYGFFFFINILFKIFHCIFDTTKLRFMNPQMFEDI